MTDACAPTVALSNETLVQSPLNEKRGGGHFFKLCTSGKSRKIFSSFFELGKMGKMREDGSIGSGEVLGNFFIFPLFELGKSMRYGG